MKSGILSLWCGARHSETAGTVGEIGGPLPAVADISGTEVLEAVHRDKKVVNGRLHFVIAIDIGATMTIDDVTEDELRAVLKRIGLKS